MTGPAVTAAGFVLLAIAGGRSDYWTGFLPGILVMSVGMTLSVAPLTTTVFDSAPDEMSGTASGINNAAARTGGLLAIAALGLAFGGASESRITGADLVSAYRTVMFVAAAGAAVSALVAALTITRQAGRRPARR